MSLINLYTKKHKNLKKIKLSYRSMSGGPRKFLADFFKGINRIYTRSITRPPTERSQTQQTPVFRKLTSEQNTRLGELTFEQHKISVQFSNELKQSNLTEGQQQEAQDALGRVYNQERERFIGNLNTENEIATGAEESKASSQVDKKGVISSGNGGSKPSNASEAASYTTVLKNLTDVSESESGKAAKKAVKSSADDFSTTFWRLFSSSEGDA